MEFKNKTDVQIAQKLMKFPLLGERLTGTWNLVLTNEFHMTNDSYLFRTSPAPGRLPLYEGKMIHQFTHQWYRLAFREIASSTNERGMIATVLPKDVFANHKLMLSSQKSNMSDAELLFCCAMLNSFVFDYQIRQRTSTTISMFTFYQIPAPRLTEQDVAFRMIVERAAKLICTTPEFQDLWETIMPSSTWSPNVVAIDQSERARIRDELDGMIAHIYELSEEEFHYILSTFPLVEQSVKDAALDAYHEFALAPDDLAFKELIEKGESQWVQFKEAACWDARANRKDDGMRNQIIQEVDAFLNSREGGVVLIGVEDGTGKVLGLVDDFKAANPQKQNRDGYQLFLLDILRNTLVSNCSPVYTISFGTLEGKDVCKIEVLPAEEPVYIKGGDFYIREGIRKRKLSSQETVAYIKQRWSNT
jgi:Putative DNA-binding domain